MSLKLKDFSSKIEKRKLEVSLVLMPIGLHEKVGRFVAFRVSLPFLLNIFGETFVSIILMKVLEFEQGKKWKSKRK